MKESESIMGSSRAVLRFALRTALGTAVFAAIAIVWSLGASSPDHAGGPARPDASTSGWGAEALADVRDAMRTVSPIAEANACGMGASSCFKCHNGTRASAPGQKKWHTDHRSVDNSCAGCHKGNARLIKKELAHAGLVKDPRSGSAQTCADCHKQGSAADLVKSYGK